jgi:hypothetical protein
MLDKLTDLVVQTTETNLRQLFGQLSQCIESSDASKLQLIGALHARYSAVTEGEKPSSSELYMACLAMETQLQHYLTTIGRIRALNMQPVDRQTA